ncbi:STAS domain-containing protein [Yoonia sp. F2084L]|uniref:STAS domain-containing protein n=1 Tax=Yoonia sp. F2084L TaxID=2926419 RepID=UPI001FF422E8|nr:STAS domain-containing protein [Yoonia sp. F2084L]MCK0095588.1 STAS domain-containing protein [Yoonia sp. F2084L]
MTATFELTATMKIDDCEKLHQFLESAQDEPVEIDCTNVTRLGGLAAQLLLMGQKQWATKDHAFTLSNPTDAFETSIRDLGVNDLLSQGANG